MYINVAECKEWKSRVTSYQTLEDQRITSSRMTLVITRMIEKNKNLKSGK